MYLIRLLLIILCVSCSSQKKDESFYDFFRKVESQLDVETVNKISGTRLDSTGSVLTFLDSDVKRNYYDLSKSSFIYTKLDSVGAYSDSLKIEVLKVGLFFYINNDSTIHIDDIKRIMYYQRMVHRRNRLR
jgi:hypothetical protein